MHLRFRSRGRRTRKKLGPAGFRVLSLVFCLFSGLVAFMFLRDINLAKASATWPTVEGKVRTSRISTSTRKGKTRHHFDISYEYAVGAQSYSGSRVRFGGSGNSKSTADELAQRYPAGSNVTVHYSPVDPSECTLETGATADRYAVLIFLGVFFLVGIGMLIGSFYVKPAPSAANFGMS